MEPDTIEASNFQLDRKTRFIIHGFIDKGEESWLSDMCKKMFKVEKVNCICVDWRGGSRTMYTQAVQNTRVVGAEIALLIQVLSAVLQGSESRLCCPAAPSAEDEFSALANPQEGPFLQDLSRGTPEPGPTTRAHPDSPYP
ncbi:Pancreatic lipase- protein 2 [Saguinus oedipus]|uniref:Triacylglycerol lipase n=1 Tax=Saguinus oedipus TaxID=9490 RepID=A0ABQ9UPP6_SAGOE|nr:Pancreatic lipase- protein 2 [Saguinus oedipus]